MVDQEAHLKRLMLLGLDGDARAWRDLLSAIQPALAGFLRRRLAGHDADVEDLVQDCLIAIHTKRATFDRSLPFTAWAYAITRYKLIDHLRREGRRASVPLEDAAALLADHTVEDGVVRRDLTRVLATLSPRQRHLVEDVRISGYSFAEAAARNGFTEGAAKVSVHRSLKTLNASVSPHEDR